MRNPSGVPIDLGWSDVWVPQSPMCVRGHKDGKHPMLSRGRAQSARTQLVDLVFDRRGSLRMRRLERGVRERLRGCVDQVDEP